MLFLNQLCYVTCKGLIGASLPKLVCFIDQLPIELSSSRYPLGFANQKTHLVGTIGYATTRSCHLYDSTIRALDFGEVFAVKTLRTVFLSLIPSLPR